MRSINNTLYCYLNFINNICWEKIEPTILKMYWSRRKMKFCHKKWSCEKKIRSPVQYFSDRFIFSCDYFFIYLRSNLFFCDRILLSFDKIFFRCDKIFAICWQNLLNKRMFACVGAVISLEKQIICTILGKYLTNYLV